MGQIVNVAKYKKNNEINAIAKHNLRCYIPTNVDGDRTASNTYFAGNANQVGISRIVTEALKDIPHRKRCKQGCQPCFSASNEEFQAMGEKRPKPGQKDARILCSKVWKREYSIFCFT